MRYFLDTEFDGFGGPLLSLALVPEDGGQEFYVTLSSVQPPNDWVERNVIPYLDMVPEPLRSPPLARDAAAEALAVFLNQEFEARYTSAGADDPIEIIADWPEDIAQLCMLLIVGPGSKVQVPELGFRIVEFPGFSTAVNSAVPHNALHDARALRDRALSSWNGTHSPV